MDSNTNNCEKNISISTIMEDHHAKEDEANFLYAQHLASVSVLPTVLKMAIELDLLELIKKQGTNALISPAELAAQIPATNPEAHIMLDRILSLLTSYSILNCTLKTLPDGGSAERLYSLAPVGKYFTKNEDGSSLAPLLLMTQDKVIMDIWYNLKDVILEGGCPFNKTYEMSIFEYNATDSRFNKIFHEAMSSISTILLKRVVETYDGFKGIKTLVDVGGGIGASLKIIISKYPTIKGINFDLPQVIQHAQSHPGVEYIGGDMFVSVPKGDAIFMKWILHDWGDAECVKVLKNCHEALPHEGKVIVVERILPEKPNTEIASKLNFHVDVGMLGFVPGAKERTEKEFQALAKEAGFKEFRNVCFISYLWVMEFCK